jgi:acyl transferase domain-containing protein/NAD(P)-dependent dehydrogenase (short-subunit alcohol dehydrogenase family)
MEKTDYRAIAIVGTGAILPDAKNTAAFWDNVKAGRYCISEVSPDRWDPALYYDPDPAAPDKTYSKIGGWVRDFEWDPLKWRLPLPPRVVDGMDGTQIWAIACTREALEDYGYPKRPLNLDRTAVILGNAMAGEKHYLTSLRVHFPEYARELDESPSFAALPQAVRRDIIRELHQRMGRILPEITEDSMPGELANCIAGRIANLYNFHGPNFVTDAACASAMAAISAAVEGLIENDFDVAVTGGIDRNMGAPTFTKFCKIGALSATGTRPYAAGADGFVMGEGCAIFVLKRLADAERDGDKIYAVLRGMGGSSDGKGKGITAPNPVGQKLAIERAWQNAGISPATATLMEGHGTSTRVGDVVEVQSMTEVLGSLHLPTSSVALGSVKSNIGHLKGAAGAAGILKTVLALRDKVLPPSIQCEHRNPDIDFAHSPLYVNTELRPWTATAEGVRRAGVSAFGFGGTNFHAVLEEYIPHRLTGNGRHSVAVGEAPPSSGADLSGAQTANSDGALPLVRPQPGGAVNAGKAPLRGALVIGAASASELAERLRAVQKAVASGHAPAPAAPAESDLRAPERLAIDYGDAAELADKCAKSAKALAANQPAMWKALRPQGIFRGQGPAPKVAFLYTGQGSQYVNMLRELRDAEPIVAGVFAEADCVMTPLLGKPLTEFIFVEPASVAQAEEDLRQTAITQPAVLATDLSLTRLLAAYGIAPDMTMGHSLGEYGALVASGALPFADALEAVSARGREMTRVSVTDCGRMAAVFAPLDEIERILQTIDGYVVIANINSNKQAVVGGASKAVEQAIDVFQKAGYNAVPLPVSHAFHTSIVASASEPLRSVLERLRLAPPQIPIVANVDGKFYPSGPGVVPQMLDILGRQVASPVQFIKGLRTLYDAGARVFVEVGPKKALQGFAEDVLGDNPGVLSLFTNHPKGGDFVTFNQALCGLYAFGLGAGIRRQEPLPAAAPVFAAPAAPVPSANVPSAPIPSAPAKDLPRDPDRYAALGHLFAGVFDRASEILGGERRVSTSIGITGAALGLPGGERVFDDAHIGRLLRGEQFIDVIPDRFRRAMLDKNITRLVKSDNGGPTFEAIRSPKDVIKLAGRGGAFDLEKEFGVPAERRAAFDRVTSLAIAAGIDALRDAGIPLVMRYKTTTTGKRLPDRWQLPEDLRDETGVIFASAFPGCNSFAEEASRYYADRARREQLADLESLRARMAEANVNGTLALELDRRMDDLRDALEKEPYVFDRRFIFRLLPMGHSQFAEYIGARGPNTALNAACASTTQAVSVAEDWIRSGRCRRVIVVSADDITSDHLIEWLGAAFLASGAAATDETVEEAALPFDRRRHGMIMGMGAAALVVESADAARERGIQPICEVLAAVTANSAFHGTRLDVQHIGQVMETLVSQAETRTGIPRAQLASRMAFVSHETYTPARGGSASAEVQSLRRVFGDSAGRIIITNTKGFTGHAMGTGIEDVVAVKALETGCVPPVANFKEVDPELGPLNLSKGGVYPVEFALRLGAGFGSQISMTLLRWIATRDRVRPTPQSLGYGYRIVDPVTWSAWLSRVAGRASVELEVAQRTLRVRNGAADTEIRVQPQPKAATLPAPPPPKPVVPVRQDSRPVLDPIQEKVLEIVAEKTGYPKDMLALDLDLEADLGIDTVKQAEMFAAIREAWNIPRDANLKLRDFPTLAHVIQFARDRSPQETPAAPLPPVPTTSADAIQEKVLAIVAEKTGYPKDMLALDLDLEADLGIDTVKQAEMFAAIREAWSIPRDADLKLRDFPTLAHVIQFARDRVVGQAPPPVHPEAAPAPDAIQEKVLEIVAEKTGYPKDMLALDLDLEADLGIDTVKQAEMFAAIREAWNIPRDAELKLRDFPTLAHVIQFARDRSPQKTTAAPPPPVSTTSADAIQEKVLEIVAEKTGYPKEMLALDLDLEADLGIDTVKQAEMFAAIREAWNIPRDAELKLRDFPTLAHVIQFARDRQTNAAPSPAPSLAPPVATFEAASRVRRRVPVPVPRPPLTLCKPTSVTLGPGSRVVIVPDTAGVGDALAARLRDLGVEVLAAGEAAAPVHGVYWLPALDPEPALAAMDAPAWHEAMRVRLKSLYATMRSLYDQIASPATFLISATRLGGQHGYDDAGATAPMGGAVTGFTKAYKRERPDALIKAVDFAIAQPSSDIAELLLEETLRDPGALEVGYQSDQRWTIGLQDRPVADGRPGLTLDKNTVFVITGAAGSIVSAITADLAAASGGTFYLLDLAPEPDSHNPDLARFTSDRDGLKRDLAARIQARGERATPALVEKELAALERAHGALAAIQAVRAAGGDPHYFAVNLTDGDAVARVIDEVRRRSGRIDVLLHAAGMDRSRSLADKDPREYNLVFDVKADGWFHLLNAIGDMPLAATVAFCSIAGRFGNLGQTDYSAANDLLCKMASSFRTTRPATRAIAIDWTAWGSIGMASRGSIPKMMELAGIEMLPPDAGIPWIRRELTEGGTRGEIVAAQALGVLLHEWDSTGGIDPSACEQHLTGPMVGAVASMGVFRDLSVETTLDPKTQPFLYDHQIDATPVLPGVMGIEAFAEASLCMLPGWSVDSVEDVNFLAPFKFYRGEPRTLNVEAGLRADAEALTAECRLIGRRTLPNHAEPQVTTHFEARVRLAKQPPAMPCAPPPAPPDGPVIHSADIYKVYFHGPAYQVLGQAWWDGRRLIGQLAAPLPPNHEPADRPLAVAPRLIELCFQTAGLYEMSAYGRMGLPLHVDRIRVSREPDPAAGPLYCIVTPGSNPDTFDAEILDRQGNCCLQMGGYRTVTFREGIETPEWKALATVMV